MNHKELNKVVQLSRLFIPKVAQVFAHLLHLQFFTGKREKIKKNANDN